MVGLLEIQTFRLVLSQIWTHELLKVTYRSCTQIHRMLHSLPTLRQRIQGGSDVRFPKTKEIILRNASYWYQVCVHMVMFSIKLCCHYLLQSCTNVVSNIQFSSLMKEKRGQFSYNEISSSLTSFLIDIFGNYSMPSSTFRPNYPERSGPSTKGSRFTNLSFPCAKFTIVQIWMDFYWATKTYILFWGMYNKNKEPGCTASSKTYIH